MDDPVERVRAGERRLLSPEVRGDRAAVEAMLAPDFREIGQSGRLWTRADMIEALVTSDAAQPGDFQLSDESVIEIAPHLYLLTYRLDTTTGEPGVRHCGGWRVAGARCASTRARRYLVSPRGSKRSFASPAGFDLESTTGADFRAVGLRSSPPDRLRERRWVA